MEEVRVTTFGEATDFVDSFLDWAQLKPASVKHDYHRLFASVYEVPRDVLDVLAAAKGVKVLDGKYVLRDSVSFTETVNNVAVNFTFSGVKNPEHSFAWGV